MQLYICLIDLQTKPLHTQANRDFHADTCSQVGVIDLRYSTLQIETTQ